MYRESASLTGFSLYCSHNSYRLMSSCVASAICLRSTSDSARKRVMRCIFSIFSIFSEETVLTAALASPVVPVMPLESFEPCELATDEGCEELMLPRDCKRFSAIPVLPPRDSKLVGRLLGGRVFRDSDCDCGRPCKPSGVFWDWNITARKTAI